MYQSIQEYVINIVYLYLKVTYNKIIGAIINVLNQSNIAFPRETVVWENKDNSELFSNIVPIDKVSSWNGHHISCSNKLDAKVFAVHS